MKTDGFSVLASSVVLAVCGTHLLVPKAVPPEEPILAKYRGCLA